MKNITIIFRKTDDLITLDVQPYGNPRLIMKDGEEKLISYDTGEKLSREYPDNIFLVDTEGEEIRKETADLATTIERLENDVAIQEAAEAEAERIANKPVMPDKYAEIRTEALAQGYDKTNGLKQDSLIKFLTEKGYK
jgi:hypothetical protein